MAYEGAARRVVGAWKQGGRRRLSQVAAEIVREVVPRPEADALTFVPPVAARQLWRGYNPAESLAYELAAAWGLPCLRLLGRAASPRPQRGLPLAERRRNVARSFRAARPAPRALVVVDDVYTSGATASAAATALRRAGARRVDVVTFARALRDRSFAERS